MFFIPSKRHCSAIFVMISSNSESCLPRNLAFVQTLLCKGGREKKNLGFCDCLGWAFPSFISSVLYVWQITACNDYGNEGTMYSIKLILDWLSWNILHQQSLSFPSLSPRCDQSILHVVWHNLLLSSLCRKIPGKQKKDFVDRHSFGKWRQQVLKNIWVHLSIIIGPEIKKILSNLR